MSSHTSELADATDHVAGRGKAFAAALKYAADGVVNSTPDNLKERVRSLNRLLATATHAKLLRGSHCTIHVDKAGEAQLIGPQMLETEMLLDDVVLGYRPGVVAVLQDYFTKLEIPAEFVPKMKL